MSRVHVVYGHDGEVIDYLPEDHPNFAAEHARYMGRGDVHRIAVDPELEAESVEIPVKVEPGDEPGTLKITADLPVADAAEVVPEGGVIADPVTQLPEGE